MAVITIAREYGAGGSSVAALLAERLGARVIDKVLIAEVARRAALPDGDVAAEDERGRTLLDRISRAFLPVGETAAGWTTNPESLIDHHGRVIAFTRAVIQDAAASGNVIVVGRGGAAELRDARDAFHVFLWAPEQDRVAAACQRLGCDEATARATVHSTDTGRAAYVREVYGVDWHDRTLYDLIIDTSRFGFEGTVAVILAALERCRVTPRPLTTSGAR